MPSRKRIEGHYTPGSEARQHHGDQRWSQLADFGLAKISAPAGETLTTYQRGDGHTGVHGSGTTGGKPCDPRTDIYALGLILFEMATGKRLFQTTPTFEGIPDRLTHVIEQCLEEDPDQRWQSASDLNKELACAQRVTHLRHSSAKCRAQAMVLGHSCSHRRHRLRGGGRPFFLRTSAAHSASRAVLDSSLDRSHGADDQRIRPRSGAHAGWLAACLCGEWRDTTFCSFARFTRSGADCNRVRPGDPVHFTRWSMGRLFGTTLTS